MRSYTSYGYCVVSVTMSSEGDDGMSTYIYMLYVCMYIYICTQTWHDGSYELPSIWRVVGPLEDGRSILCAAFIVTHIEVLLKDLCPLAFQKSLR